MRDIDVLLDAYGESHRNPWNKAIHRVAVPAIVIAMLGFLRALPFSMELGVLAIDGATIATVLALAYYLRLSVSLTVGMTLFTVLTLIALAFSQAALGAWYLPVLVGVFGASWLAQFAGHAIEGRKPSFLEDLQFLLVGPIWLLADGYRRLGVAY